METTTHTHCPDCGNNADRCRSGDACRANRDAVAVLGYPACYDCGILPYEAAADFDCPKDTCPLNEHPAAEDFDCPNDDCPVADEVITDPSIPQPGDTVTGTAINAAGIVRPITTKHVTHMERADRPRDSWGRNTTACGIVARFKRMTTRQDLVTCPNCLEV